MGRVGVCMLLWSQITKESCREQEFFFSFQSLCGQSLCVKVCVHKHLREDLVMPRKTKVDCDSAASTRGPVTLSDTVRVKHSHFIL